MESLSRSRSSATAASSSCTRLGVAALPLLDQAGDARRGGRQWGLELVRHRADERRLEPIRLAKRLGVRRVLLETLPLDRRRGEVRDGGEQAHVVVAGRSRLTAARPRARPPGSWRSAAAGRYRRRSHPESRRSAPTETSRWSHGTSLLAGMPIALLVRSTQATSASSPEDGVAVPADARQRPDRPAPTPAT